MSEPTNERRKHFLQDGTPCDDHYPMCLSSLACAETHKECETLRAELERVKVELERSKIARCEKCGHSAFHSNNCVVCHLRSQLAALMKVARAAKAVVEIIHTSDELENSLSALRQKFPDLLK